jgi:hypothetical protein
VRKHLQKYWKSKQKNSRCSVSQVITASWAPGVGPRDDGFRCGIGLDLDLHFEITSVIELEEAADDDLSWWS